MIRTEAGMPTARFTSLIGIPERSYRRWQQRRRAGRPVKGPWPTPAQDLVEAKLVEVADRWPAWGHRKIAQIARTGGTAVSDSTALRALKRNGRVLKPDYTRQRRDLAAARRATFVVPPSGPNQVWQVDFTEYETTRGGVWRISGCADYWAKAELGWHVSMTQNHHDAISAIQLAIDEAERLNDMTLLEMLTDPVTGELRPIAVVSDNGPAFKATGFERFIDSRPELIHIRTRRKSPQQNGVRERAFGSLKYEHLYRLDIPDGPTLAAETEAYRQTFNWIRPHEAIGMMRPMDLYLAAPTGAQIPTQNEPETLPLP
jgi:transposase InsO family protein